MSDNTPTTPPPEPAASTPFQRFAETAEAVASTRSRNAKADRLAGLFEALSDDDLKRAARFFAGRLFPLADQRTVSVGQALLLRALTEVSGTDPEALRARLVTLGDLGDVAHEVLPPEAADPSLQLRDVAAAVAELAETRGTKRKEAAVIELLRGRSGLEVKYLVKLLGGDLRIGMLEGGVEAALARWTGHAIGAVQRANMLTGDLGHVALLARHGRLADAHMRLFHPIKFMLATAADSDDDVARQMPTPFAVEDKFDGIRAQAHVAPDPADASLHGTVHEGARVALFSRTLDAITRSFPDLVGPLAALADADGGGLILDGEIVPTAPDGDQGAGAVVPFQSLQPRLGRKTVSEEMLREAPVAFVAYDVLFAGGEVMLERPFRERRARLDALPTSPRVRRSDVAWMDGVEGLDDAFAAARDRGNEGLMVKAPDAPYKPGRRGRDWLKVKRALATLDVVVTSVERGSGGRSRFLSDFTFAVRRSDEDPTLLNVGKAYSGLTDEELGELTGWFEAHTTQSFAHGRVRLVEPEIVLEVAFDRVQPSKRHKSGYALRFPRIVRRRPDKPPAEIDTLDAVRRLADGEG